MSRLGDRTDVRNYANIGRPLGGSGSLIDPGEVWRNLVAIDPDPPGPLATPPFLLALPDDRMDGEHFLSEAKKLYREWSDLVPVDSLFRPIPRATKAREITFVLPDPGMDEREFAEKAVAVRVALETQHIGDSSQTRWA